MTLDQFKKSVRIELAALKLAEKNWPSDSQLEAAYQAKVNPRKYAVSWIDTFGPQHEP